MPSIEDRRPTIVFTCQQYGCKEDVAPAYIPQWTIHRGHCDAILVCCPHMTDAFLNAIIGVHQLFKS